MNLTRNSLLGLATLAALGLAAAHPVQAQAPFTAYNVTAGTVGNQAYTGSLGMDFQVNAPIEITALGVFDSGSDGLSSDLTAYIYSDATQESLAALVFTPNQPGDLEGGSRFLNLAVPLYLGAGTYTVVAEGYGNGDNDYNTFGSQPNTTSTEDTGGGLITFTGTSRYGAVGAFPTTIDGGPSVRYDAGTFKFAAAPEPSSVAGLGLGVLGMAGLVLTARRRKALSV